MPRDEAVRRECLPFARTCAGLEDGMRERVLPRHRVLISVHDKKGVLEFARQLIVRRRAPRQRLARWGSCLRKGRARFFFSQ